MTEVTKKLQTYSMGEQVEITRIAGELMKTNPGLDMAEALRQAMSQVDKK